MTNAVALAIKVTSDARGAAAGIDSATGKVSRLGRAGQVAGRLLAAGLLIAAGAAIKFVNAAADDAQAQAQLVQTAQKAAGATKAQTDALETYIAAQGKAKGVADDELRPALSKLITATHDVGKAQQLASLAMDISARSGKSLDSVAQSLAKAQTGSVAGLSKYGVVTKDAAGHAKSLAEVQKDLAATYKGAAAAGAETAAGKAKILSVQMGELQEQIGAKLLPVMGALVEIGLKVVDWISKNVTVVGAILGALATFLAIIKAVTLAQAAYNAVLALNPIVLVVAALAALAVALVVAYKKSQTFREIVDAAFSGITKVVSAVVDFIRDHWKALLIILGGPVGLAVVLIAGHFDKVKAVALAVIGWVQDNWPAIKAVLVGPFQTARDTIDRVWSAISSGISAAKSGVETAASAIKDAVQGVVDKFQALLDKIQSVIDKIGSVKDAAGGFLHTVTGGAVGRTSAGRVGSGSLAEQLGFPTKGSGGSTTVILKVEVPGGFIGDEVTLARELRRILDTDLRRLGPVA